MNLSNTEKEMIQMMRAQEAGQRHLDEPTYKQVTGNLLSTLDAALSAALLSDIEQVKQEAQLYLKEMRANGASNLQEANELGLINDRNLQTLITSTKEASKIDPRINYSAVVDTATLYNDGVTDQDLQQMVSDEMASLRNTDRSETWDTLINPNSGSKFQQNSITGDIREYLDPVAEMAQIAQSDDIAFMEYVAQGNSPDSFGSSLNGDSSLKVI